MLQIKSFHTVLFPSLCSSVFGCLVIALGSRKMNMKMTMMMMMMVAAAATPFTTQKQSAHTTVTLFGNHLIHDVTISATVGNYNWQTGTYVHKVIITHAQLHYFSRVYFKQTWSTKWPPYSLQYLSISVPLFSFTLNIPSSHTQAHEKEKKPRKLL